MLKNLWIIHRDSGICIYNQKFKEEGIDYDADMFTGFVSAIITFSREITAGKHEVKSISLGPLKISYQQAPYILVSLCVDEGMSERQIKQTLETISTRFLDRYANKLDPDTFNYDTLQFREFNKDLQELHFLKEKQVLPTSKTDQKREKISEKISTGLANSMKNFLDDHPNLTGFQSLQKNLKKFSTSSNARTIKNTIKMAREFANQLLPDMDFSSLFKKMEKNVIREITDDDYSF